MRNYYRARSYDPNSGRFIQKDPIGLKAGDTNFYRYVGNNPLNSVDPSGLDTCGVGFSISATLFSHTLGVGVQYVWDDNGGAGLAGTIGYGPGGSVGLSASGVAGVSYTNANSINDLSGVGGSSGASAFSGFGAQNEVNYGNGYQGYTSSLGYGGGASVYTQITDTGVYNFNKAIKGKKDVQK